MMNQSFRFILQAASETTKDNSPVTEFINEAVTGGIETIFSFLLLLIPIFMLIGAAFVVFYILSRPKKRKK